MPNVELRAFDIANIDASFGQFDYIVCHGVYSWVPPAVQEAILRVCSENLRPNGVAYVSYNVYPGWKAREIVRDAMILRGAPRDEPDEKLSYARGMLEFLEQSARPDRTKHVTERSNRKKQSRLLQKLEHAARVREFLVRLVARRAAQDHGVAHDLARLPARVDVVAHVGQAVRARFSEHTRRMASCTADGTQL